MHFYPHSMFSAKVCYTTKIAEKRGSVYPDILLILISNNTILCPTLFSISVFKSHRSICYLRLCKKEIMLRIVNPNPPKNTWFLKRSNVTLHPCPALQAQKQVIILLMFNNN